MAATILILEDDPALQELLSEVLQDEGYTVIAAATLPHLLSEIPASVDLLISDILVELQPVGLDAINAVRKAFNRRVPAILCTGAANHVELYHEQIEAMGALVLHKPFSIDALLSTVNTALSPSNVCA